MVDPFVDSLQGPKQGVNKGLNVEHFVSHGPFLTLLVML